MFGFVYLGQEIILMYSTLPDKKKHLLLLYKVILTNFHNSYIYYMELSEFSIVHL
jgi:hypothetical protein